MQWPSRSETWSENTAYETSSIRSNVGKSGVSVSPRSGPKVEKRVTLSGPNGLPMRNSARCVCYITSIRIKLAFICKAKHDANDMSSELLLLCKMEAHRLCFCCDCARCSFASDFVRISRIVRSNREGRAKRTQGGISVKLRISEQVNRHITE